MSNEVILHHNKETGIRVWSVCKSDNLEDWIDTFSSRRMARKYCRTHNLTIIQEICSLETMDGIMYNCVYCQRRSP